MKNFPFAQPILDTHEEESVLSVLRSGVFVHGEYTKKFESSFKDYVDSRYALTLSNCTSGLFIALQSLNLKPGDPVGLPALTHVATAHAIEAAGLRPVFADVHLHDGNIDIDTLPEPVKALVAVHFLGIPCDIEAIHNTLGVPVIEDCALALGSSIRGKKAGTLGIAGSFSFYPSKHITSLEGGMLTTNDPEIYDFSCKFRSFGYDTSPTERKYSGMYDVVSLGMNFRMNEVESAIGFEQLKKLPYFLQKRMENYFNVLPMLEGAIAYIRHPFSHDRISSFYCLNILLPLHTPRHTLLERLRQEGMGHSIHYPCAVPLFSYYAQKYHYTANRYPHAEYLAAHTVSLPLSPHITSQDLKRTIALILDHIRPSSTFIKEKTSGTE